jgi:hypothetical protein
MPTRIKVLLNSSNARTTPERATDAHQECRSILPASRPALQTSVHSLAAALMSHSHTATIMPAHAAPSIILFV